MAPRTGDPGVAPLEIEPRLVESAVRVALERGAAGIAPPALARLRFTHRRKLDDIYARPPGEAREAAFRDHYRSLFGSLGFDRRIEECLEEQPALRRELRAVLVRSAAPPEGEGVELWEGRGRRGSGVPAYLVVSLAPWRFARPAELTGLLSPRLRRAAGLLDPDLRAAEEESRAQPESRAEPQSRCPLCSFATMVWASAEALARVQGAVRLDFPAWRPSDGCCEHCADRYAALAAQAS